jgi:hypothetical protein
LNSYRLISYTNLRCLSTSVDFLSVIYISLGGDIHHLNGWLVDKAQADSGNF